MIVLVSIWILKNCENKTKSEREKTSNKSTSKYIISQLRSSESTTKDVAAKQKMFIKLHVEISHTFIILCLVFKAK